MLFRYLFLAIVLVDLVAVAQRPDLKALEWVAKPLIMLSLGFYFYQRTLLRGGRQDYWVLGAIVLSLCGDVSLMFEGGFLAGLGAFLLAHVCYISAFVMDSGRPQMAISNRALWLPMLLVLVYGFGLLTYLMPHLGALKIPVVVYALTILTMLLTALNRYQTVTYVSYWQVLVGAILFVLSDSMIAISRFAQPFGGSGVAIMLTYAGGQFLIIDGYLKKG